MIPTMAIEGVPGSRQALLMWKAKVERLALGKKEEQEDVYRFEYYFPSIIYEIEVQP